ncbi:MAG: GNAT family protein [Patescibacteria group bacterium]|jgi:RimJ/RimL family protein N-acetyltransferase
MKAPIIKTKKFTLRPWCLDDAASLARHINHPKISLYTLSIPYPYTPKDARSWLSKLEKRQADPSGGSLYWAIEIDGQAVGGVSLRHIIARHKAEIGYWLGAAYWGQGIMSEVVKNIKSFAFKTLKLKRLWAGCFTINPASRRVLEKNGFELEGVLRKEHKKQGKFVDDCILSVVK